MQSEASTFPSDKWIPDIVSICGKFHSLISRNCAGGRFLVYRDLLGTKEKPGIIVRKYHRIASLLKVEIFGEHASQERINHHKIMALYIRSFLKHPPFSLELPDPAKYYETCRYTQFPNEYFIIDYMETIFKAANNDIHGELLIDPAYEENFIKLLYYYKNNLSKLDPLSFANNIILIEKQYFKSSKPARLKKLK